MLFVCLCGIPASGKSTFSKTISSLENVKLYECDEFFNRNKNKRTYETIQLFHQRICDDLVASNNVIIDGTYTIERTRLELLDAIKNIDCKKIIIVLTTSLEECLLRNQHRDKKVPEYDINGMYNNFQFPKLSEGWDEIIVINNDEDIENYIKNLNLFGGGDKQCLKR